MKFPPAFICLVQARYQPCYAYQKYLIIFSVSSRLSILTSEFRVLNCTVSHSSLSQRQELEPHCVRWVWEITILTQKDLYFLILFRSIWSLAAAISISFFNSSLFFLCTSYPAKFLTKVLWKANKFHHTVQKKTVITNRRWKICDGFDFQFLRIFMKAVL